MKLRIVPVLLLLFVWFTVPGFSLQPGENIPGFSVVSGSGQMLIRNDIRDRKVVLFYEDRNQLDSNQSLKEYLDSLDLDRNSTMQVVIVDCSDVGLFKKLWEDKLEDYSRKSRLSVYGDWNGKLKESFSFQDKDSNFLIIDASGTVIYKGTGEIASREFSVISNLLK